LVKNAFITGIEGFTGRYLAAELNAAGYTVTGLARHACEPIPGVTKIFACDLGDLQALRRVIDLARPSVVAHLAAISFAGDNDFAPIYRSNVIGSRNLLEALVETPKRPTAVLLVSSGNIYGNSDADWLAETHHLAPMNDYSVSKIALESMARMFADRVPAIIVRPFNYSGVGQSERFLLPKIVSHLRAKAKTIELGNLDVARDFSDVRTVAKYYALLLECPEALGQTYNVCSGRAYALREILAIVQRISGQKIEVRVNSAFVREKEIKVLTGDPRKLSSVLPGVSPIPLDETLRWMLAAPAH
jgi:nucleoside-diphosphate-sugar epimerase